MKNLVKRFCAWLHDDDIKPDEPQDTENTFLDELTCLLNRHSMENNSGTSDHILAQYLKSCLEAFDKAVQVREAWYGRTYAKPDEEISDAEHT